MSAPLFSIILPAWNRADCIRPSIESVVAQTLQDYELLIIDDGSDDGLEQAVRSLLTGTITYHRRPHLGVGAARNFGLDLARGAYIAYLDSDNTWHPAFLSTMYRALRSSPGRQAAYCSCNRFTVDEHGMRHLDSVLGETFDFKKLLSGNYIDLNTFIHARAILNEKLRFDENLKRLNDWDFILNLTRHHKPLFVRDVLVDYNNALAPNTITANEDFFGPLIKIKQRYKKFDTRTVDIVHDGITYRCENLPDKTYYNYLKTSHQSDWNTVDFAAPGLPYIVQIEPTNYCNLSCTVCPAAAGRSRLNRDRRHMSLQEFKHIVDNMQDYLLLLVLWDWGEPFLNPDLPEMIRYAAEKGIKTVTSTNGHFLQDRIYLERILSSGLTTLIIAIDSLKQDKYVRYRQGGNLGKAMEGLRNVLDLKKKLGSPTRINLRMVLMKSNEDELPAMRAFAQKMKVDIFSVKTANPTIGETGNDEDIVPVRPDYRRYAYRPGTFERIRIGGPCGKPWFMINVHSNGNVVACCYDYDQELTVGNALEQPLSKIWNSQACRDLRKKLFYDKDTLKKCRECDVNFKLSQKGWFVEVAECNLGPRKRASRALRKAARKFLPQPLSSLFAKVYRTLDTAALTIKNRPHTASAACMPSTIYQLDVPFAVDREKSWTPVPVFQGKTQAASMLSCHVSALAAGCSPHPPHEHREEEILLLLSGELDIIVRDEHDAKKTNRLRIQPRQLLYYPRGFAHTLQAAGSVPANYLMLKWHNKKTKRTSALSCGLFDVRASTTDTRVAEGTRRRLVFEGRTGYLKKLHCHVSTLEPLAGYEPHEDPYDVIIIVLDGEVETLRRRAAAHSVIYYAAGEPHGLRNPSETCPAHYAVFELHHT